jgi:hypothetical protein
MVFEMPEEISGQKNRSVLCQGRIIRARNRPRDKEGKEKEKIAKEKLAEADLADANLLAASIVDYKFIR